MTHAHHILIIEDDPLVCDLVAACLEDANFKTTMTDSGQQALNMLAEGDIDLAIVDLGLPDMDGLSLTREIKSRFSVGIVIVSGRGETTERIIGLEVGADDYIAKPFEPRELLARVRSVLRRTSQPEPQPSRSEPLEETLKPVIYGFDGWKVDVACLDIETPDGDHPRLSTTEFSLLQAFIEHPNRVLSRDQLIDYLHGDQSPAFDRSIDVQITRLRKKIEDDPKDPRFIKTIRNRGYIFTPKVTRSLTD